MNPMTPSAPLDQSQSPKTDETQQDRANIPWMFAASLIAMLPWPLIAIGLCVTGSMFEQSNEFILMFGGVTMIFLLPIGMFDPPEWVFTAIFVVVWVFVLLLPVLFAARRKLQRGHLVVAYVLQTGFSIAQAGLGLLMIVGRNV